MSPTARSLHCLRRLGFTVDVVERWLPHACVRRDLFGFADVLAVHARDRVFLLVQCTTAGHVAHRLAKAKRRPELLAWLKAGGIFELHGWHKRGERWTCRRVAVGVQDLAAIVLDCPRHRRKRRGERQQELFV
jgi:hypothetical protein